jgi:hypothetical protein
MSIRYEYVDNHENVAAYVNSLPVTLRGYAALYWDHLRAGAAQPKITDFDPDDLSFTQAQQIRLKLVQFL